MTDAESTDDPQKQDPLAASTDPTGEETPKLKYSDPNKLVFLPEMLDKTVIAVPLLKTLEQEKQSGVPAKVHAIIIDLNQSYRGDRDKARSRVKELVKQAIGEVGTIKDPNYQGISKAKTELSDQYVFARLEGNVIRALVRLDTQHQRPTTDSSVQATSAQRAIFRIWPDFPITAFVNKSISTVKADAARISFSAFGDEIVWAVIDSGIDRSHPHFKLHQNLDVDRPLRHRDFTGTPEKPLEDTYGHGTHVAGIIAGELSQEDSRARIKQKDNQQIRPVMRYRDENGEVVYDKVQGLKTISGMAPRCKLVSLKVLDGKGDGLASNLIAAIEYIQRVNDYGRRIRVHGVNMSVGYEFEPEWFACGQSPLCVEVDRLVRSGVVVVVAAGNTGYGFQATTFVGTRASGLDLTINDPGNADMAITVGSTHREAPHIYGVSYFSSKGPTGDGRRKPDLVAPGEKILSCAAGAIRQEAMENAGCDCNYIENSGTSMAAPHVSGVIAAFLSVRREFIGRAEAVKEIFLSTATDLKRDRSFQGHGLVDLMRAIQSV